MKSCFLIILNSGILISDPTFEEEQLAAGLTSITMEGTFVTHMYKPGKKFL
jgi:exosome complex RNA-binding protein Rrp42 (RNase PH superfamily)